MQKSDRERCRATAVRSDCALSMPVGSDTIDNNVSAISAEDVWSQKAEQRVLAADFGHKCQGKAQHNKIGISWCNV